MQECADSNPAGCIIKDYGTGGGESGGGEGSGAAAGADEPGGEGGGDDGSITNLGQRDNAHGVPVLSS